MDNLAHGLVGAALARAGLDRTTPLATATLVVAANAPDIDVLAYTQGEWYGLACRRGITHGVPALVVLPFLVAGGFLAWDRWVRRRRRPDAPPARPGALLALAALGVFTHPVLDWMNTYGMRWWLPFDGTWSYGDALFIIDPWIWLALGAAAALGGARARWGHVGWGLAAALTSALVLGTTMVSPAAKALWAFGIVAVVAARALGRPAEVAARRRVAAALTAATVAYVAGMVGLSRAAEADVRRALEEQGLQGIRDVMIQPLPANPFAAEVVVESFDRYYIGSHRWLRDPRYSLADRPVVPRFSGHEPGPGVRAARELPDVSHYLTWSRFPYWSVEHGEGPGDADVWRVRVGDARYTDRTGGLSGLVVEVPRTGDAH